MNEKGRGADAPLPDRRDDLLCFVQTKVFERKWTSLGLGDAELRALELAVMADSSLPPMMRGTGGIAKDSFCGAGNEPGQEWLNPRLLRLLRESIARVLVDGVRKE